MNATALWRAFRRILVRLGRWFARRLATKGRLWLIDAMVKKIAKLRRKLSNSKRGRRWTLARIRIRQHAIRWLIANAKRLNRGLVTRYDKLAARLPRVGQVETIDGWSRQ